MKPMRFPRLRRGGAGVADYFASLGHPEAPIRDPWFFPRSAPTSTRRRWSEIHRVPMVRDRAKHPRPWEGPRVDLDGLFFGVLEQNYPGRLAEVAAMLGNHPLHEWWGHLAELNAKLAENHRRAPWPQVGLADTSADSRSRSATSR